MSKIKPFVSVCVQTYQHVNYIKTCLDGILMQQTSFPFEIILGEDESDDGTREICIDYANKYPDKIKLFLRSREDVIYINGNATGRFNVIENLKVCNGKYIALCEGDDYWTDPLKLQKQVDLLEQNKDVNICFHRANILKNDMLYLHEIPSVFENSKLKYVELLKHFNFIATASVVFRNTTKNNVPKWFKSIVFGDLGLYKIVSNNKFFMCINEVMSVYRIHDNGIYSGLTKSQKEKNYLSFYKSIYTSLNDEEKAIVRKKYKKGLRNIFNLMIFESSVLQSLYTMYDKLKRSF